MAQDETNKPGSYAGMKTQILQRIITPARHQTRAFKLIGLNSTTEFTSSFKRLLTWALKTLSLDRSDKRIDPKQKAAVFCLKKGFLSFKSKSHVCHNLHEYKNVSLWQFFKTSVRLSLPSSYEPILREKVN